MASHRLRPGSEWHFAAGRSAMHIEPGEDRLGVIAQRFEAARKVAELLAIPEQDVAVPGARPQAGLPVALAEP